MHGRLGEAVLLVALTLCVRSASLKGERDHVQKNGVARCDKKNGTRERSKRPQQSRWCGHWALLFLGIERLKSMVENLETISLFRLMRVRKMLIDRKSFEGKQTGDGSQTLRLLAERAALGQASLTTGGLREDLGARAADNNGLGVREDGGDGEAARALDVHEERVGVGHKSLELVAASLLLGGGVEKVDSESLRRGKNVE